MWIAAVAGAADLTIDLDTAAVEGRVEVRLYPDGTGYPSRVGEQTHVAEVELSGTSHVRFEDLPVGRYAVVVFLDEDRDGAIATNWFGMPKEPVGVYLRPGQRLWGPPSFRGTSFEVQGDDQISVALVVPE